MFKRLFNISIYVFVILVPILPLKIKLGFLPLSADFIIASILIFFGLCYLLFEGGLKELYNLKDKGLRKLNLFIGLFVF